jgi:peroxiredoxin
VRYNEVIERIMEVQKRTLKNVLFLLIGLTIILAISACGSASASTTLQTGPQENSVAPAAKVDVAATKTTADTDQAAPQVSQELNPGSTDNSSVASPQTAPAQDAPAAEAPASGMDDQSTPAVDTADQNNTATLPSPPAAAPAEAESAAAAQPQLDLETKPEVGSLAPDFTLQTLDGQTVRLADMRGRPVVISYWATWCGPCKIELPILQSLSQQYAQTGIQILTVNAIEQDKVDAVQGLITQMGLTMPVLLDQQNQFQSAYKQLFFPTSYFIDSNGVVRFIKLGDASEAELRGNVEKLINNQL